MIKECFNVIVRLSSVFFWFKRRRVNNCAIILMSVLWMARSSLFQINYFIFAKQNLLKMDIFSTKLNDFINKSNLFQATHSIKWSKQTAGGQISPCFEVSVNQFMVIYKKPKRTKKANISFCNTIITLWRLFLFLTFVNQVNPFA